MSVLVTEANLGSSVNTIRSLGKRKISITASDINWLAAGFWSKYCQNKFIYYNPFDNKKYIESIIKAQKKYKFNVIIAPSDATLKPLVRYQDLLKKNNIKMAVPEKNFFFNFCDKATTYQIAEKTGVPFPITFQPKNISEVISYSKELDFPIVVKPTNLTGGRGIKYLITYEALKKYCNTLFKNNVPFLMQEYIPGSQNVYTGSLVYNQNNECITEISLRKIRESPVTGGTATYGEKRVNRRIIDLSKKLLKNQKWVGMFSPEFKVDPRDNEPKLMEVNPRLFGYSNLAIQSGADLPYLLYKISLGEKIENENKFFHHSDSRQFFMRFSHDLYVILKLLTYKKNKIEIIKNYLNSFEKKPLCYDYLSRDDFIPFIFSNLYMIFTELNLSSKIEYKIKKDW